MKKLCLCVCVFFAISMFFANHATAGSFSDFFDGNGFNIQCCAEDEIKMIRETGDSVLENRELRKSGIFKAYNTFVTNYASLKKSITSLPSLEGFISAAVSSFRVNWGTHVMVIRSDDSVVMEE